MLSDKFKEIIENLEENMETQNDLNYAKAKITELSMIFFDEVEQMNNAFQHRLNICEEKIDLLELTVKKIGEEFIREDIEEDFEFIKCPYCNLNFFINFDISQKEIKCPECKNIIELDWGSDDEEYKF